MDQNQQEMNPVEAGNKPEWEKPDVTEFDINLTTLDGGSSLVLDGVVYS